MHILIHSAPHSCIVLVLVLDDKLILVRNSTRIGIEEADDEVWVLLAAAVQ